MKKKTTQRLGRESRRWLEAAAQWRVLSVFFQLPSAATRRELNRLAKPAPRELRGLAREWTGVPMKLAASEFHRVLGAGGIPAVESSYDPNALAGRGPLLADIAGFHEAFGYRPETPPAEVPDHIAVELDFLSFLAFKIAFALHEKRREDAEITIAAYNQFQKDHLYTWLAKFAERLERTESLFFIRAAGSIPRQEVKKSSPASLPILATMVLLVSLVLAPVTAAQSSSAAGEPVTEQAAPAAPSPGSGYKSPRLGEVILTGSLRARMENWGWFEAPAFEDSYTFGAFNLRLALEQKKERFEWKIEGLFPALASLPTGAIAPAPQGQLGLGASYFAANGRQDASAVFRQGYVRFKGQLHGGSAALRLGRFEFAEGAEVAPPDPTLAALKRDRIAQRLIGSFGFSHVGRGFDGVEYSWGTKQSNLTLVAARPTEGVFQLRSLHEVDVDFYYGAFTRQFTGKFSKAEARAFVLHYHDGRGSLKSDNRSAAARAADTRNIRLSTLGGHALVVFDHGGAHKTDLLLWGAAQLGRWGDLDHHAGAVAIELGHQFPGAWKPWLRGGYFRSTGDANPGDDEHSTFFQALPTPRIYARFPFFNLMNNQDVFVEFRCKPAPKLGIRGDVRYLQLSNRNDLWYLGGGAFQDRTFGYVGRPSNQGSGIGTLFDVSLDYTPTSYTTFSFYAGGVRGGSVQSAIYPGGGSNPGGRFLYLELLQRF